MLVMFAGATEFNIRHLVVMARKRSGKYLPIERRSFLGRLGAGAALLGAV